MKNRIVMLYLKLARCLILFLFLFKLTNNIYINDFLSSLMIYILSIIFAAKISKLDLYFFIER